jgi:hypothetical protein
MALYFLLLDRSTFDEQLSPALAACWRQRSFAPCRGICQQLQPAARAFAVRYHLGHGQPLMTEVIEGLPFNRVLWQHLAGELLWFSAAEIPELQTDVQGWTALLGPRAQPALTQVHRGSRDLRFGGGFYRPDHAAWNDSADVARLADFLAAVRPGTWRPEDLPGVPPEEGAEELALLREWFGPLAAMYRAAAERRQVIVCETVE